MIDPKELPVDEIDLEWIAEVRRQARSLNVLKDLFRHDGWDLLDQMLHSREQGILNSVLNAKSIDELQAKRELLAFCGWLRGLPLSTEATLETHQETLALYDQEEEDLAGAEH